METVEQKTERNCRVQARYDELMREGRRGHYETMFRVVREEVERERERRAMLAGELQALRNHVAHWRRSGIDDAALARADEAIRA